MRRFGTLAVLAATALATGCATSGGGSSLSEGGCQSIRQQLNRLDAKGVRSAVEAQAAGRPLSPARKADANAYNKLLSDYLGARCHEAKT